MTTGKPYAGSAMGVETAGARAPAPLHVSIVIVGANSIWLLYGASTFPGAGIFGLVLAVMLTCVMWSGVLFDWFVAGFTCVRTAATPAPLQIEPRPSRVPPSPVRLDRAA